MTSIITNNKYRIKCCIAVGFGNQPMDMSYQGCAVHNFSLWFWQFLTCQGGPQSCNMLSGLRFLSSLLYAVTLSEHLIPSKASQLPERCH